MHSHVFLQLFIFLCIKKGWDQSFKVDFIRNTPSKSTLLIILISGLKFYFSPINNNNSLLRRYLSHIQQRNENFQIVPSKYLFKSIFFFIWHFNTQLDSNTNFTLFSCQFPKKRFRWCLRKIFFHNFFLFLRSNFTPHMCA